MVSKKIDNQLRKEFVLGVVVNEYIRTVSPVSSSHISRTYLLDLSPATIRNILAELEQEGFLTHPHTSAGRIPTQEGYRYYVDNLMNEIQLLEGEKTRIKEEYEQNVRDLEVILDKTTQVISDLTQCTTIISVDGWNNRIFCNGRPNLFEHLDSNDVHLIRNILTILEEKKRILSVINRNLEQKINIFIGHEIACGMMEDCSLAVSSYQTGRGMSGRIAILGPTCMNYQRVSSALDYFSELMNEIII